ncbi:Histidyl-tRNA synthetase [Desulfovibrio sp. X2]|uniref:histidine--tRNA ligase n=1 Tax=Desulfovibrio sp. X2 TaxID=941449 RepID=UPI000358EC2B|nr:histidine--tRNA ligase [Desulfovibrio sp. X2]EPR44000.1 Histidyl-tRNA synthetase [Desulfovibrio sp. X2]
MAKIQKIKGFADLFAAEAGKYTFLEGAARTVFSRYGYGELRTPVVEFTELFAKGIGADTDVVGKEMYTFPDRKGRSLTLRPEATAGVVRAFAESGTYQPGRVFKYFTFGPMFRYERPQKGRMRQFHQINVECFGSASPYTDAEVLLMLHDFLSAAGLTKLSFELNTLGCPECRPAYRQALSDYFASLPADALCEDCRRRMTTNPLRVLDCKVPSCREATDGAPSVQDHACARCKGNFEVVTAALDAAGLAYTVNPRLVRGLDYYQGTTFEVVSGDIGSQSSVAGGGRYDGLVKLLGGPDVPGIGFACGMERLALLLPERKTQAPDFHIAVLDAAALPEALALAQRIRAMNLTGEVAHEAGSMKSQLRAADRSGARFCLIMGGDELAARTVVVKAMSTGEQMTVPLDDAERVVLR